MAVVHLREVDAGTDNACWVVCAEGDPGAVVFTDRWLPEELPHSIMCSVLVKFPKLAYPTTVHRLWAILRRELLRSGDRDVDSGGDAANG